MTEGVKPPRKIPTLVGLLLVGVAVVLFSLAFERTSAFISRAAPAVRPTNVEITNISDSSFTISWLTSEPATGFLLVEKPGGKRVSIYDERDAGAAGSSLNLGRYTTHTVTVRNLLPTTLSKVTLVSNGKRYLQNSVPYQVTTGPAISLAGVSLEPAFGSVTIPHEQPAEGALVYLTLEGSQKISTLVSPSGSWVIPLNLIRTSDLTQYLTPAERVTENIIVRTSNGETTAVTDTLNDNPVPDMVIGKSYDFRKIQAKQTSQPLVSNKQPSVLGEVSATRPTGTVTITKPLDKSTLTTNLPLIQGTGVPGKQVLIVVGITHPVGGTTTVGGDGIWRFTPSKPLSPGKQSVTATSSDAQGKPVALTHIFEVLKSGTQVLGEATPSATLTPTLATTPPPTSTLAGEPLPESGSALPTVLLLLLGLGLLTGGAVVFIK